MKNKTQGFTLIELLIVIAIIGILAAVLIPQLLGARIAANKRAVQAHSSNVYKAMTAVLAEDPTLTATSVSAAQGTCMTAVTTILTFKYGWNAAPGAVASCAIAPSADGNDFIVTVTGNASADSKVSVNGAQPN